MEQQENESIVAEEMAKKQAQLQAKSQHRTLLWLFLGAGMIILMAIIIDSTQVSQLEKQENPTLVFTPSGPSLVVKNTDLPQVQEGELARLLVSIGLEIPVRETMKNCTS